MTRGFAVALSMLATACFVNPVHDDQVSALGPEAPGVGPGPTHRGGQPCLVCHGGLGPASAEFSVAGTVFAVKGLSEPLPGAVVTLTDTANAKISLGSNSAGNFYVNPNDYLPKWPLHVQLTAGSQTVTMNTHMGRNGSCASCHMNPPSASSVGEVYMYLEPADIPDGGLP